MAWAGHAPLWLEWALLGLTCISLVVAAVAPDGRASWRAALLTFFVAVSGLTLIDQHRLQPWAYQFLLLAFSLALATSSQGLTLARLLTISIYFHSGLSKLDVTFLDTHGQQLVFGTLQVWGLDLWDWSDAARKAAAAALPVGEILIALGLCVRRLRTLALVLSLAMHAALLLALGPRGLDHKPAVLIWNVYFIAQNVLLFAAPPVLIAPPTTTARAGRARAVLAAAPIAAAVVLPLLEPWGWFDHWPAWAVYASRPERVWVSIDPEVVGRLPNGLQPYVQEAAWEPRPRLRIDRWSLDALAVPVYPEDRFHLGVALALARRYDLGDHLRVTLESDADRWTGARTVHELHGADAIAQQTDEFLLNPLPRDND